MNEDTNTQLETIPTETEFDDGGLEGARQFLAQKTWRTEALQIPLDSLTDPQEQDVIVKCINQEQLQNEEMDLLEEVLGRYRPAIQKHKPLDTIENYEENVEVVQSEKDFLRLLDESQKEQTLTMYYPLHAGREAEITLEVHPITDAQAVMEVQENLKLFEDFTQEEVQTFTAFNEGEELTEEEIAVAQHVQNEIAKKNSSHVQQAAIEFLSLQTGFQGRDSSYETMKEVYSRMEVGPLFLLFKKVQDMTELDDVNADRMFRDTR